MGPLRLIQILKQEYAPTQPRHRRPEPDLVMAAPDQVEAYTSGGAPAGCLLPLYRLHLEKLAGLVRAGDTILDLGCGSGQLLALMAKTFPEVHFVGVDLSEPMLKTARKICSDAKLNNVELVLDDIVSLSQLGSQVFDGIISCLAFHHLPDQASLLATFETMNRLVKPRGQILISDLGPIRSERSVELLVEDQQGRQSELLSLDYEHSLRAAFTMEDWGLAVGKVTRVNLTTTRAHPINFFVQIHSEPLPLSETLRRPQGVPRLNLRHQFEYFLLSKMLGR